MTPEPATTAIVLAGGASRRMGADKRLVEVDGVPMLRQVIDRLAPHSVLVVVDPRLGDPPIDPTPRIRVVPDIRLAQGPLAALEAGLEATNSSLAIVVAGDMPWLEPGVLTMLVERLRSSPSAALVCLISDAGAQPFPMACRRTPMLARVSALLDGGERRLRAILDGPGVQSIGEAEWRTVDPSGRSVLDIDTPADLARVG